MREVSVEVVLALQVFCHSQLGNFSDKYHALLLALYLTLTHIFAKSPMQGFTFLEHNVDEKIRFC